MKYMFASLLKRAKDLWAEFNKIVKFTPAESKRLVVIGKPVTISGCLLTQLESVPEFYKKVPVAKKTALISRGNGNEEAVWVANDDVVTFFKPVTGNELDGPLIQSNDEIVISNRGPRVKLQPGNWMVTYARPMSGLPSEPITGADNDDESTGGLWELE